MIDVLVDFFNFFGTFVNLVINISYYTGKIYLKFNYKLILRPLTILYFAGKLLVTASIWTFDTLISIVSNITKFCVVFCEDFSYFSSDIWSFLSSVGITLNNGIKNTINNIVYVSEKSSNSVSTLISEGGFKLSNVLSAIECLIGTIFLKTKELLLLIGSGAWFLVTLLPKLAYTLTAISYKNCQVIWEKIIEGSEFCFKKIGNASQITYDYFTDVPLHCAIGLIIIYLAYKFRSTLWRWTNRFVMTMYRAIQRYGHALRLRRIRSRRQENEEVDLLMTPPPLLAPVASTGPSARKPLRRSPRTKPQKTNGTSLVTLSCVVCLDRKKTVVVLPCRHLCLCRPCSRELQNFQSSCPLCREEIDEIIDTYI